MIQMKLNLQKQVYLVGVGHSGLLYGYIRHSLLQFLTKACFVYVTCSLVLFLLMAAVPHAIFDNL